jgi:hypothetical protein
MDDQRRHRRLTMAPSREPSSFYYDQRRGASSCYDTGQVVGVKSTTVPCMTSSSLKSDGNSSFWKF